MINAEVINYLKDLFSDPNKKNAFETVEGKNSFALAKTQEKFVINNSNGLFSRISKENKVKYGGEFEDIFGNKYDLRVGSDGLAGSINMLSLLTFGAEADHYYICTTKTLDKLYIISARELLEHRNEFKWLHSDDGEWFLGEKCYGECYGNRYPSYI